MTDLASRELKIRFFITVDNYVEVDRIGGVLIKGGRPNEIKSDVGLDAVGPIKELNIVFG